MTRTPVLVTSLQHCTGDSSRQTKGAPRLWSWSLFLSDLVYRKSWEIHAHSTKNQLRMLPTSPSMGWGWSYCSLSTRQTSKDGGGWKRKESYLMGSFCQKYLGNRSKGKEEVRAWQQKWSHYNYCVGLRTGNNTRTKTCSQCCYQQGVWK